jgi:hypothetical protein
LNTKRRVEKSNDIMYCKPTDFTSKEFILLARLIHDAQNKTTLIYLNNIDKLAFVIDKLCVYSAVRTQFSYIFKRSIPHASLRFTNFHGYLVRKLRNYFV